MEVPLYVLVLTALAAVVAGDIDQEFCKKYMPKNNLTFAGVPAFYDNFYVFIERKDINNTFVVYQDESYSQASRLVYGTYRGQDSQSKFWVAGDLIMDTTLGPQLCLNRRSDEFSTSGLLGVTVDAKGSVIMSSPEIALGWDKKVRPVYTGPSSQRGITTNSWAFCTLDEKSTITTFNEWHFADPTVNRLPAYIQNAAAALPVTAYIRGINNTNPNQPTEFLQRLDFTFFDSVPPQDYAFQITPEKLCGGSPNASLPLPSASSYFRFKGEQITIFYPNSQTPNPAALTYTTEEYTQLAQLFIQEKISPASSSSKGNDKSVTRTINDYSTGLSFIMDLESGQCTTSSITTGIDSIPVAGGHVKMRTSQQFFDLDSNQYQYLGVHTKRGIECDAWSAYFTEGQPDHDQDELYVWYFATANWKKVHQLDATTAVPVTLEIQQPIANIQFNFYDFDTQDQLRLPDVSLCLSNAKTLNVEFFISASYAKVVAPDIIMFYRTIYGGLIKLTNSTLRITSLDIQPAASNDIVVRFKLLEIMPLQTLGSPLKKFANNQEVYSNLNQAVNSGQFNFDLVYSSGKITVHARVNSVSQYKDGRIYNSDTTDGFSAGAMGGLAVGMILLGLILGVVVVFVVKKVRAGSDSSTNMTKLSEESSS